MHARPTVLHSLCEAIRVADRRPDVPILLLERSWRRVDRTRQTVQSLGLDGRVRVHHRDARAFLSDNH